MNYNRDVLADATNELNIVIEEKESLKVELENTSDPLRIATIKEIIRNKNILIKELNELIKGLLSEDNSKKLKR